MTFVKRGEREDILAVQAEPRSVVVRSRLVERIGVPPHLPITLITAPAGYGKSTLIAQWMDHARHRVAWVPLTSASNTLETFLGGLMEALLGASSVNDPETLTVDLVLTTLREFMRDGIPVTLVFDDVHHIRNGEVFDVVDGILSLMPNGVSIIFASRHEVPFSLARMRASGMVRQLTESDLTFTPEEVLAVVNIAAPTPLTSGQIRHLQERTEGWIAGIRLALSSLEHVGPGEVDSLVDTWSANRWLDDYFVEEVLAQLPVAVREFVEDTVVLEELTVELCDAIRQRSDSQDLLSEAVALLAFIRPVGVGFRYHALFAESVERISARRRSSEARRDTHRRAAEWFAAQGMREQAIDHAIAGEAWPLATRELKTLCEGLSRREHNLSILHWLGKLPEEQILLDTDLTRWYIQNLQYTGKLQQASELFAKVEADWLASENVMDQAYAYGSRGLMAFLNGELGMGVRWLYQALHLTPLDRPEARLRFWSGIIQGEFMLGNTEVADLAYRQAAECRRHLPVEQRRWSLQIEIDNANHQALRGDLQAAMELYRHQILTLPALYRTDLGRFQFRLAAILLERNELDEAERLAVDILDDITHLPYRIWTIEAVLTVARIHAARGQIDRLEELLQQARGFFAEYGGLHNLNRIETTEADHWLETSRLGLAREWAERMAARLPTDPGPRIVGDPDARLTWIRVMFASGEVDQARAYLDRLIAHAEELHHGAGIVSLSIWQTVIRLQQGDRAGARISLERALRAGHRGGFVRSFLTPGYSLDAFVREVRETLPEELVADVDRLAAEGVWTLHEVFPNDGDRLVVKLTRREQEVLQLLPLGLSSRQIGEQLFISERTVKKHVGNILEKLHVNNRIAAVQRASQLGLIIPE